MDHYQDQQVKLVSYGMDRRYERRTLPKLRAIRDEADGVRTEGTLESGG